MVVINLKKKDGKKKHKRGATEVEQGAQQQAQAVAGMATFVVDRRTQVRNTTLAATRADGSYHDWWGLEQGQTGTGRGEAPRGGRLGQRTRKMGMV